MYAEKDGQHDVLDFWDGIAWGWVGGGGAEHAYFIEVLLWLHWTGTVKTDMKAEAKEEGRRPASKGRRSDSNPG